MITTSQKVQNAVLPVYVAAHCIKEIKNNIPKVYKGNPLKLELISFINSVKNNTPPIIDGSFALDALSCAIKIQNIINDENI